jgi:hypothetical protein
LPHRYVSVRFTFSHTIHALRKMRGIGLNALAFQ